MIKHKTIVHIRKPKESIEEKLRSITYQTPELSIDLKKYLKEFNKMLESPHEFNSHIKDDIIFLTSKGVSYWPSLSLKLRAEKPSQTTIEITFSLFWLYAASYLFILLGFSFVIISFYNEYEKSDFVFVCIIIGTIMAIIPYLGKVLQDRTIKYFLEKI